MDLGQPDSILGLMLSWTPCAYPSLWPPRGEGSQESLTFPVRRVCLGDYGNWFATVVKAVSIELFLPGRVNIWWMKPRGHLRGTGPTQGGE